MADKFDLQIVKDRMESFLISTNLVPIHSKLLLGDEYNLNMLMDESLLLYKNNKANLRAVRDSSELADFPDSVKNMLFSYA
ncbi:hypothetical protein PENTCL1PPCAC_19842, partial [Pristionchus entomophagus]